MKKIIKIIRNIVNWLLFLIVVLAVFSTNWALKSYNSIQPEEILFYLTVPIDSTESGIIVDYLVFSLLPTLIISVIALYFIREIFKKVKKHNIIIKLTILKKSFKLKIKGLIINITLNVLLLILAVVAIYSCLNRLELNSYISNQLEESTFIAENYVNAKDAKLTFPKKKRNLIYIYVESLETTYFQKEVGGNQEEELMPRLRELAKNNTNFSNTDKLGGATQVSNLTWTTAGMVGTTAGVPLKVSASLTNDVKFDSILSGAYSLGEILEKEGYNQMIMFGSDATFGNRDIYFKGHGNYQVYDYYTAIEKGKISSDYSVWWGFEDSKLFNFSKEEITNLSKQDKPFNFTLLTTNTHNPDGYVEADCENKYDSNYANSIVCSANQVAEFVAWIKQQEFYKNTTIVITGDHLSMDSNFFKNMNEDYERTVFNLFINPAISSNNTKNRLYTTMDLFPTTLASLGVKIPKDRLALGTNLFSNKKTLMEKYGKVKLNQEIQLKSDFYNQNILNKK